MDKKNVGYLHALIFTISAVVLVYAGDQVKSGKTGLTSYLMRASAMLSSICIVSIIASFAPASASNKHDDKRGDYETDIAENYFHNGAELEYIHRNTVKEIEVASRQAGHHAVLQNTNDYWNRVLTYSSLSLLAISVIIFGIGIGLL